MKLILIDPSKPEGAARLALLANLRELEHGWQTREAITIERHHDPLDEAMQMVAREQEALVLEAICDRQLEIKDALARLDAGTWGVCDGCGEQIPPKRLKALPWAALCVECQEQAEMAGVEDA